MGKKSKKASASGKSAAILIGVADVLLIAVLVAAFLIKPVKAGEG